MKKDEKFKKENKGITLIALVITVIVLLILAGITISTLAGNNGILTKVAQSKDETEQAEVEEIVDLAITSLLGENEGSTDGITPKMIADEVNKMEDRSDIYAEDEVVFPTKIIFPEKNRQVEVNLETDSSSSIAYMKNLEPGLYETGTSKIIMAWDNLIENGYIYSSNETTITASSSMPSGDLVLGDGYTRFSIAGNCGIVKVAAIINLYVQNSYTSIVCSDIPTLENAYIEDGFNGDLDFYKNALISSVRLPEGLSSISEQAFRNCPQLTNITIPSSVTSIEDWAFSGCSGLTSINIPSNVTSIGEYAFQYCSNLTSITIPSSVTSIGDDAFNYCTSLTSITIPENATIGEYAFYNCYSLTNITIPTSLTSIGGSAFNNTAWYNNQPDGDIYINKTYYAYKGTMPSNTSIEIKEGTTSICGNAFFYETNLASITIPSSVTSIGRLAFVGCKNLTTVNYTGESSQWSRITMGSGNTYLTGATINYNYNGET